MDNNEDSFDETQGSTKSVRGKRGIIWGNAETSALIKIWGEAEIKYALSSLKRNYEIFEMISSELKKIGFSRTAEECRTKTKALRKLYKLAVIHNNTSGSGRSKFLWYDEMAQIFRTDTSIHPLRTTESESAVQSGIDDMEGSENVLVTLDLFETSDVLFPTDVQPSCAESNPTDGCEQSTSGCSTAAVSASSNDASRRNDPSETTNYEATLDPARRLAMLRKRKQRASAAARLDNTLSGFVNWVQRNTNDNKKRLTEIDKSQKWFQNEVVSNLRVASSSLEKLTEYLTSSHVVPYAVSPRNSFVNREPGSASKDQINKNRYKGTAEYDQQNLVTAGSISPSEPESSHNSDSNDTDSDLEGNDSQSLLVNVSELSPAGTASGITHSTPVENEDNALENGECSAGSTIGDAGSRYSEKSPVVPSKASDSSKVTNGRVTKGQASLRTPHKRLRKKRQIYTP